MSTNTNTNTGHLNTGDLNTGDHHVGCFNTKSATHAYYFNTLCNVEDWNNAKKPLWIFTPSPITWIPDTNMTDAEKVENPTFLTLGGYLRKNDMAEQWRLAYEQATAEDVELTRKLPCFDADVFLEITGIDLRLPITPNPREIIVDGVIYVEKGGAS